MITSIVFWAFQVINGVSALSMFLAPKKFHESMMREPQKVYTQIGFSPTAVEMVHNVIRGQGAALLAISVFLFFAGSGEPLSFLMIALACGLTLIAHIATMRHHVKSSVVMAAIGSIGSMYVLIAINLCFAVLGAYLYFNLSGS